MNFFRRFASGSDKKSQLVSNKVSKTADKSEDILASLKTNTQDLVKIAPPAKAESVPKPSIRQKFELWRLKRNVRKNVKVELVSFDEKGVNSLVVDDELVTIQDAKKLLEPKNSKYKNTNLEVVLKSLDFGTNLREKSGASGLKIGSKLYRSKNDQVFSDKARSNSIARIVSDEKYIEKVAQDLKDLKSGISIDNLSLDQDSIIREIKELDDLMVKMADFDNLNPAHKTKEIEDLRSELNKASIDMKNVLSELMIMDEQVSSNMSLSIKQLAFLDTATNEESIDQLSKLVASMRELDKGPDLEILNKLFEKSELISSEKKSNLKQGLIKKFSANNNPEIRAELINNLSTLSKSISLQSSNSISEMGDFLKDYANIQKSFLRLQVPEKLTENDKKVFAQIKKAVAKNAAILIERYTEKLQDLDYQHDNTIDQSNLKHELEFLRGVTPLIPELDVARDICSNLVDFAEQAGLKQEGQMSALSQDLKTKILKHYDAGTLARPQSESFEEATRRDKSQQVFYSRTLLNSLDKKLGQGDGTKNMRDVAVMLDPIFSGDYKMIALASSSLKNPKDLSGVLLDDYTVRVAEVGAEISNPSRTKYVDIEKTKINLEHQIRTAKRSLVLETGIDLSSLDSIKLSSSIKAMKARGLDAKFKNLDLLFVNAALCEIKLATLEELSGEEDKSIEKEQEIFERRVNDFIQSTEDDTKLKFVDSKEFQKMRLNPSMVEQADIITSIASTGFSDFKTLNKSVQAINITAKAFSSNDAVKDVMVQQFMSSDIDLLAREIQSNAMTKLFDVGHVSKIQKTPGAVSQMSNLLDSDAFQTKMEKFYEQMSSDMSLEKRSAEIKGRKVGRFVTNIVPGSSNLKSPDGKSLNIKKVGDVFAAIDSNNQFLKSQLVLPVSQRDSEKIKACLKFEQKALDVVSGNVKNSTQLTHMSILYGYDQFVNNYEGQGFSEYLDEINNPTSNLKNHLETKFAMSDNAKILFDTQIRTLSYLKPEARMGEMLKWYNDIHIGSKDKSLKTEVDDKSALIGESHIFSGIGSILAPMEPGDEFIIDKTGKLTVKNDQKFVNLAQEALTEGAVEVQAELAVMKKDGFKVIKEKDGYSVLISNKLGAEFGLGIGTAMGLAESKFLVSGGIEKGHKIKFGNSAEQQQELNHFIRKVFVNPELTIEDLSRSESIFIQNGKEAKIGVEASIGLPSVINSIAVATGYIPSSEDNENAQDINLGNLFTDDKKAGVLDNSLPKLNVKTISKSIDEEVSDQIQSAEDVLSSNPQDVSAKDVRDDGLSSLSGRLRSGQNSSISKKFTKEVRRGETVVTQSYRSEKEYVGFKMLGSVIKKLGVAESTLNSHYTATSKTTEKFGMITDHTIRTEMTIKTSDSKNTRLDRAKLALSSLLKNSYEHDIFMNDQEFQAGMESKLGEHDGESPVVIVERKVRQDVLEELHNKAIALMNQPDNKTAAQKIAKITESTLNNPDNIEVSRVLLRSDQSKLRSKSFKTTEVKVQTSEEVTVNRRALEEAREAKLAKAQASNVPKPTKFRNQAAKHLSNSNLSK